MEYKFGRSVFVVFPMKIHCVLKVSSRNSLEMKATDRSINMLKTFQGRVTINQNHFS